MSYATLSDLQKRLGDSRFAMIFGTTDTSVAEADLASASAVVDGYLAARYATPVTAGTALALLTVWTVDLACELAYLHAGGAEMPDKIKKQADTARQCLRDVSSGKMLLSADAAESAATPGGSAVVVGDDPVFTRDQMAGY